MSNYCFEDLEFPDEVRDQVKDISGESWRKYVFKEGSIHIEEPVALQIRSSGAHAVVDSDGVVTYVPAGWRYLQWQNKVSHSPIDF